MTRAAARRLGAGSLGVCLAAAFAAALALAPGGAGHPTCASAASAHAAVVVQHGDAARTSGACVAFAGGSISGYDLLTMSGIHFAAVFYPSQNGYAICQIEDEPKTPDVGWNTNNCLGSPYWVIYIARSGGTWTTATAGASDISIHDGDAEGFRYSSGGYSPPPSPANLCPLPQPPPSSPSGGGGGSPPSGGGGGSGSGGAGGSQGGPQANAPGPASSSGASPTPGGTDASPSPGAVALGAGDQGARPANAGARPGSSRGPRSILGIPGTNDYLGMAMAAVASAGLAALLAGQLLLPRLKR